MMRGLQLLEVVVRAGLAGSYSRSSARRLPSLRFRCAGRSFHTSSGTRPAPSTGTSDSTTSFPVVCDAMLLERGVACVPRLRWMVFRDCHSLTMSGSMCWSCKSFSYSRGIGLSEDSGTGSATLTGSIWMSFKSFTRRRKFEIFTLSHFICSRAAASSFFKW